MFFFKRLLSRTACEAAVFFVTAARRISPLLSWNFSRFGAFRGGGRPLKRNGVFGGRPRLFLKGRRRRCTAPSKVFTEARRISPLLSWSFSRFGAFRGAGFFAPKNGTEFSEGGPRLFLKGRRRRYAAPAKVFTEARLLGTVFEEKLKFHGGGALCGRKKELLSVGA